MKRRKKEKKYGLWILILILIGIFLSKSLKSPRPLKEPINVSPQEVISTPLAVFYSFIPYWEVTHFTSKLPAVSSEKSSAENLIYFGVKGLPNGTLDTNDSGYSSIDTFVYESNKNPSLKTFLTLRMLDTNANLAILDDISKQQALVKETMALAKSKGFDGVILDLEISGLPTETLKKNITAFSSNFAAQAHQLNLISGQLIYGDVFYRVRPYDIEQLAQVHDLLLFMMYDLHKAAGEPGPNFPANGDTEYGYSLTTFLSTIEHLVPQEKRVLIFGMYGYNWSVDEQERQLKPAHAQRLKDIRTQFATCVIDCIKVRDAKSSEMKIQYRVKDTDHVLWYEDENSVMEKIHIGKSLGTYQFGFWTYGYW